MYGPVPGGSGEVWEIKEYDWLSPISSQADVVGGIAQLAGYVALLNACCVSVTNGNCGKGTFGYWVNTVNPFRCGKVLGWICVGGLIVYAWTPSPAKALAVLAVIAVVLAPELTLPALAPFVPAAA